MEIRQRLLSIRNYDGLFIQSPSFSDFLLLCVPSANESEMIATYMHAIVDHAGTKVVHDASGLSYPHVKRVVSGVIDTLITHIRNASTLIRAADDSRSTGAAPPPSIGEALKRCSPVMRIVMENTMKSPHQILDMDFEEVMMCVMIAQDDVEDKPVAAPRAKQQGSVRGSMLQLRKMLRKGRIS